MLCCKISPNKFTCFNLLFSKTVAKCSLQIISSVCTSAINTRLRRASCLAKWLTAENLILVCAASASSRWECCIVLTCEIQNVGKCVWIRCRCWKQSCTKPLIEKQCNEVKLLIQDIEVTLWLLSPLLLLRNGHRSWFTIFQNEAKHYFLFKNINTTISS